MSGGRLHRVLGVGFGIAVATGATVGIGILRTPGEVAAGFPGTTLFLLAWVIGGLHALLGALAVTELATALPEAGGFTVYARRALGPYAGFVVGWTFWLVSDGSAATMALVAGESAAALFPSLAGAKIGLALGVLLILAGVQAGGVRWAARTQGAVSVVKVAVLAAFSLACLLAARTGTPASAPAAAVVAPAGGPALAAVMAALAAVIFTYDGWYGAILFSEEMREPARQLPRAVFGTVAGVTALYLLFNLAIATVLPAARLAGNDNPAATAAGVVFGPGGAVVLRWITLISALGAVSAVQLGTPRILLALARGGRLAAPMTGVSGRGTPTGALLVSLVVEVVFVLSGRVLAIVQALGTFLSVIWVLTFAAVFVLRAREPGLARPYRVPGHPLTTALALAAAVAFLVAVAVADPRGTGLCAAAVVVSYPLYRLQRPR